MAMMCDVCKCTIGLDTGCDNACGCCNGKSLEETLQELESCLALVNDDMRDAGEESNPIIFAESGPNRFNLMSLFFNDSDGVRIQEDLELNEISVQLFNDYTNIELTEGALFEWAITYYKENY